MSDRPLCFVLMPFGEKPSTGTGASIDFDRIYEQAIKPAVEDAGLQPIRADEERAGGMIHVAMFERLLLCDFAVADLTTANANVFYELGIRHAARPHTTLPIFAEKQKLPFDVQDLGALPYSTGEDNRFGDVEATALRTKLAARLGDLRDHARREATPDSPVFRLLPTYPTPDIDRLKTDRFRENAEYAAGVKRRLAAGRSAEDVAAIEAVEAELETLDVAEAGVIIDLFLSWRALGRWERMRDLYERMPVHLQRAVMVREQLGFALNRLKDRDGATAVLEAVIEEQGASSETCGILGRVYKDRWQEAVEAGDPHLARGWLDQAIATYRSGFEADWRDAYPGINWVTLLDIRGDPDSLAEKERVLPVVRFAVERRIQSATPDYWDHATLLELAVLEGDEEAALAHLADALAMVRESWEPGTTAKSLRLIRKSREDRGAETAGLDVVIEALEKRSEG